MSSENLVQYEMCLREIYKKDDKPHLFKPPAPSPYLEPLESTYHSTICSDAHIIENDHNETINHFDPSQVQPAGMPRLMNRAIRKQNESQIEIGDDTVDRTEEAIIRHVNYEEDRPRQHHTSNVFKSYIRSYDSLEYTGGI